MTISMKDREILRTLAAKYMAYAVSPEQEKTRALWQSLNALDMKKPMLNIDQIPWHEMDVDGSLICQVEDDYFRQIEWNLRTDLYRMEHMPVDTVLNPYILLPRAIENTGYGITDVEETAVTDAKNDVTSHAYQNQFEEMEDVEKIQTPVITIDRTLEAARRALAEDIFAGIAPVKMEGITMHLGLWDKISAWMGVENCYIEMLDRPELLHAIMERLTTATLDMIRQVNELGVYDVNKNQCHCSYTYTSELPSAAADLENPTTHDGWAFGLAQLMSSTSPAMTEEFEVPYMQRLFPHFGAIYYGCCERLDNKLDIISQMPNIRKISCSPWSDREHFAEVLPAQYILSNKPNPALLAFQSFDEDAARADLRRTIDAAKANGKCVELILKDLSTLQYDPKRLWRWAEIAREEALR